ncbi:MAG: single-stranded DNA-binding protein [Bacteroidetes bacterium]|uniref:Single-stranded DNA-binding protein n=1 Tax=Candidatus Gallipaludibacter merdavium TaxID=2840839 RepID=A0A9D9HW95_9BACT|nr:single-stranded DNA-binding protein [Candidatus Gallipaludibacter merdavium]
MSVNKVILLGNVGKDPEVRYIDKDVPVARFTLATSERGYTTQNGVQVPERTEWHNIVAWRGLGKLAENYIRKGSQLYIEGHLQTRSWEKDGVARYTTEIIADVIQLLDRREKAADNVVAPAAPTTVANEPQPGDDLPF